ncbi:hypothetical protein [Paenibacillus gallinarum]|uniref:Uncharacterized protein n=2 Tax=Paenibacillus TaxID=44249 RepID=A0ABR8SXV6_9BACL|nr:hypothetical protein [Paenibacillus gallinarum]MBD7968346.1 hypothetical protein [Paenibacillus gallinarum]
MEYLLRTKVTTPLRRMGIGFIFIIIKVNFHINFYSFDIFADFIGYFLIYRAAVVLSEKTSVFHVVSWLALLLSILSLPKDFMPSVSTAETFQTISVANHIYTQGLELFMIILLYFIYKGLCDLPLWYYIRSGLLKQSMQKRCLWLIGCLMLKMLIYPFFLNLVEDKLVFVIVPVLLSVILYILFVRVLYRMAKAAEQIRG